MLPYQQTPVQEIESELLKEKGVRLLLKREDLNHPFVSGNKWWKLKYNLKKAFDSGLKTLLTFGGAYSNHIHATAAAAREVGFQSIGIIRGEEVKPHNPTLSFAKDCGMHLHFVSRDQYRAKTDPSFIQTLRDLFGDFYLIPEGGSNELAVKGVVEFAEIVNALSFDYLCVPVGTGGTLAGLVAGIAPDRKLIGFSALKGGTFLKKDVSRLLQKVNDKQTDRAWHIDVDFHFGGYGKVTDELLQFLYAFEQQQGFRLDPIYTGKMIYGVFQWIKEDLFPRGATILAIHTGGLQGWGGLEERE